MFVPILSTHAIKSTPLLVTRRNFSSLHKFSNFLDEYPNYSLTTAFTGALMGAVGGIKNIYNSYDKNDSTIYSIVKMSFLVPINCMLIPFGFLGGPALIPFFAVGTVTHYAIKEIKKR